MNALKDELRRLYSARSKHSAYQNIPDFVSEALGYSEQIDEGWRGDRPRLEWILDKRTPGNGERWVDFGANTGFFTLSLARQYPQAEFVAVEANPDHAQFIARIADCFELQNVNVIDRAIGLDDLATLPRCDLLLHLNVLHHAGHDFDQQKVRSTDQFPGYARRYLSALKGSADAIVFQIGSNWGGDKTLPLVPADDDIQKLRVFSEWLHAAGWNQVSTACARHLDRICYDDIAQAVVAALSSGEQLGDARLAQALSAFDLASFPGEFYRRPLFLCNAS